MKISVICVFNNKEQFDEQLNKSLKEQDIGYELIALDNTDNCFKSAAIALNYGANHAKGDILIFPHQDIYLKTETELRKISEKIRSCEIGTIVGTQGVLEKSKLYYTNLTSGKDLNKSLIKRFENRLYNVSCVDEGLFGMKKDTWSNHNFDERLCDNWHLYCVEACLFARKNGHKVYVYPAQIHHYSRGSINIAYMCGLKRLCKHYRKDFKYIWTTCYKVRTNFLYSNGLVFAWSLNRIIRGKFK